MKKQNFIGVWSSISGCKLIQKKSITLLFAMFLLVFSATAQGQKITIKQNNKPLNEILNEIESKSGYSFLVRSTDLNLKQIVSLDVKDKTIAEILSILFNNKDINYEITGNRISIFVPQKPVEKLGSQKNTKKITGVVIDKKGETIIGATVAVKGTAVGTITDINGNFSVDNLTSDDVLIVSYIGLKPKEVKIGQESRFNIVLEDNAVELQEVVALGYTTQKRRDMIGSIAKVTSENFSIPANSNFAQSLQGKMSGVYVSKGNIRIRGVNSISLSTQPLWIIDGVPGDGSNLHPSDIESVSVLKDASATALYGSSGANGVIVVTTKSMKNQKTQLNVDVTTGFEEYTNHGYDLLNTSEFLNIYDIAKQNGVKYSGGTYTPYDPNKAFDWNFRITQRLTREEAESVNFNIFDEATRIGRYNQVYLTSSKAFDKGNAMFSATYRNNEDQIIGISSDKLIGRFNFNFSPVKHLDFIISSTNSYTTGINSGATLSITRPPIMPLYDATNPTGYWAPGANPIIGANQKYSYDDNYSFSSLNYIKANLEIPFIKGLKIGGVVSANFGNGNSLSWNAKELKTYATGEEISTSSESFSRSSRYLYRAELNYDREFQDHHIGVLLLAEGTKSKYYSLFGSGSGLIGTYKLLGTPGTKENLYSTRTAGGSIAYIGRLTYKFKDRYLVDANLRRDALSNLSPKNQWATFPSIGLGWILSDESFLKSQTINLLKIRGSYGKTGNAAVPNFAHINSYNLNTQSYSSYDNYQYTSIKNIGSDVQWETSTNFDAGVDFGFLQNRINGSVAFYNKQTSGLLLQVPLPPSTGISIAGVSGASNAVWKNIGNMKNEGVEMNISALIIDSKDFRWGVDYNITWNKNKVLSLSPAVDNVGTGIFGASGNTLTKKGEELATFYMADFAGIDSEKGIPMIWERDVTEFTSTGKTIRTGNKIPATASNTGKNQFFLTGKSPLPDVFGGLNNNFKFKSFDLGINITYSFGSYFYNNGLAGINSINYGTNNLSRTILADTWQKPGDNAKYPELIYNGGFYYDNAGLPSTVRNNAGSTSQFIEKGDYIQLKEISLGYNLPESVRKTLKVEKLRIYANVNNVAFWSATGSIMNPELQIGSTNIDGASRSFDLVTRTYSVGIQANF